MHERITRYIDGQVKYIQCNESLMVILQVVLCVAAFELVDEIGQSTSGRKATA